MSNYQGSVPDTEPARKWLLKAACAGPDYEGRRDLWFPTPGDQKTAAEAKRVCAICPVRQACLTDALREEGGSSHDSRHGIRGGYTGRQRRTLYENVRNQRKKNRQKATDGRNPGVAAAPLRKSYTTLRALVEDNTKRLVHGHLAWTGPAKPSFKGQSYNPKQVAFILDRGRQPVGRVLTTCGLPGCVRSDHIADDEERARCGTRAGYRRHRENGEEACGPYRRANTDADNRLRRTGTTKAAA